MSKGLYERFSDFVFGSPVPQVSRSPGYRLDYIDGVMKEACTVMLDQIKTITKLKNEKLALQSEIITLKTQILDLKSQSK